MNHKDIKIMAGLLICTSLLLGLEVQTLLLNRQYKAQLEQYNHKLDEKIKLSEEKEVEIQKEADDLSKLQKQVEEQLNRVNDLKTSLEQMSVVTDIPQELYDYVLTVAKENNYRPEMLMGIIQTESKWQPNTISRTNDYGLCQINESNFKSYQSAIISKYGKFDALDPKTSIDMMIMNLNGIKNAYTRKFSSTPTESSLLLAYNSGQIKENFNGNTYTTRVLTNTAQYQQVVDIKNEVSDLRQRISRVYTVAR